MYNNGDKDLVFFIIGCITIVVFALGVFVGWQFL
jgi:hypothetical protein